jgi:hypothetical protein
MKLAKLPHNAGSLIEFFQGGLEHLGAVCERTWHDRVQIVAEGTAAKLWNPEGALLETELSFPPPGETRPRDASKEVFPGCPLTFHLAEALRPSPLLLQRACLQTLDNPKPPATDVAERLWHAQVQGTARWKQETPFVAHWNFSLLILVRSEIQAIDQHWSLHRLVLSMHDGKRDESLASSLDFSQVMNPTPQNISWPQFDPAKSESWLRAALHLELADDLSAIRRRQEMYLRRELDRIDSYFEHYEQELTDRQRRSSKDNAKIKLEERVTAARTEHERRRRDQVQRHEIRVIPHIDALLLLAEPAWKAKISTSHRAGIQQYEALFVPRTRRWVVLEPR